jgi:pimeloyl-ACP methyl ester carboxylesterase
LANVAPLRTGTIVRPKVTTQGDPWDLLESGSPGADHTVLLLAGALCTTAFFEDLMAEPELTKASVRLVAATLPGFGDSSPPDDLSMESYARLAGGLAADLGCEAVLGHSVGANVAIEMAAAGEFSGPLVLLSPSFSRKDESKFPRVLDRVGRVLGHLPYAAMFKVIGPALKGSLPADRHAALVAELKKNDPRFVRRQTRRYLEYLDRHGSLVSRLCDSGARAWVVFGENDDVGLSEEERRELEACARTTLVTIPGAGHFTMIQEPRQIAEVILKTVSANETV